ncbi:MAG TPA: sigma-70 family RNA polymerase sigma factor [Blastocatellia bacterium]|jgi:RNA polymerase sigma factor (TIGR02999 family)
MSERSLRVSSSRETITDLLIRWREGDKAALDKLVPVVYKELRRMASYYMRRRRPADTLQTSALINEAYLRLLDHKQMRWQNRAHFFAVAAQAMRRILVDHARARNAAKREGGVLKVSLDQAADVCQQRAGELIRLDDALKELARFDARKNRIVELRYFGGLSVEETAEVLEVSAVTVKREWRAARLWLLRAMKEGSGLDS